LKIYHLATLLQNFSDPAKLEVPGIHDRGYVFVDGELQVRF
jgi:hypothetical protein